MASSNITLSAGVRQNLLALQNTAALQSMTQSRLATGKKVNSALDNPTNFFTSSALSARASDLSALLDAMSNGIKTLETADNGLTAITKTVESMKATISQARQDASFKGTSYTIDATTIGGASAKNLTFSGGAVSGSVNVALNTTGAGSAATAGTYTSTANFAATIFTDAADAIDFDISVDGAPAVSITIDQTVLASVGDNDATLDTVAELNEILTDAGVTGVTATVNGGGKLVLTSSTTGTSSSVEITNFVETDADTDTTDNTGLSAGTEAAGAALVPAGAAKTVDEMVAAINGTVALQDKVKASNDGGKLRIENLSTVDLTVTGVGTDGEIDGTTGTSTVGGNTVRRALITQFNDLRNQLDKIADDSSFNGINLLKGDTLKLVFNEINTSSISIQSQDPDGISSADLGIDAADATEFSDNAALDTRLGELSDALSSLRSQSSGFGSNLSIVQNRQEFTKSMINTLQTGADALVLADSNEEAANLLALQTRQQLSSTALSLASQADQAVLRLF